MSSSINPLSSASYASAGISTLLAPQPASGAQTETVAAPIASSATSPSVSLTYGGVAAAPMQAILQLAQGGYGDASSAASPSASGASNPDPAAKAPADANAAPKASPLATLTDTAFSGRLSAAVKANDPLASIKALALLAGDLQAGTVSATAQLDAPRPGSPGAKVNEALQELAKDSDKHIANAAQSLLSKIAGVSSNGAIVYKDGSQGSQTSGGNVARALSEFSDEAVLGLARNMAAGSGDIQGRRTLVSNVLRAVDNHTVIVMQASLLPHFNLGTGEQAGSSAVSVPGNSVFLDNGSLVAIFPEYASNAPWRWYLQPR
jgi:hypothetical protein